MLSAQDNALVTQTSKGTPMGELFRRFWLPIMLPEELPEPDCAPCGLRCVYHGWKFDASGQCVDMPSEPEDSDFRDRVRIDAYPVREWGG